MDLRYTCLRLYAMLKHLVAPGVRHSQDAYADVLRGCVNRQVEWLDLGCGHQVLPDWRAEDEKALVGACKLVVGVDLDLHALANHRAIRLRVKGDISRLPFADERFDLVTANMVVEHLENPALEFREIGRVLRSGGLCVLLTPNAYGYPTVLARCVPNALKRRAIRLLDGRDAQDVFPTYYRANTARRLTALADASSLEVLRIEMVNSDAVAAVIPPLAVLELAWLRMLMASPFRPLRSNIIAVLRKRPAAPRRVPGAERRTVDGVRLG